MAGQHPPGLFWVEVGEEHHPHFAVVHCSQLVWGTGEYHQLRSAVEVLEEEGSLHHSQTVWGTGGYHLPRIAVEESEEESLQCQVDSGEGMSYPHWLKECLEE